VVTRPNQTADLEQRHSDAPPARMAVLTAPGAAAAKLSAWSERRAPRDLYDLWALADRGLITPEAVAVFVTRGPFGQPPSEWIFTAGIDEQDWRSALGHQTRLSIRADQALDVVRTAWLTAAEGTARA
jgi:predicted nucleotidyltransferase component of viral defense system